MQLSQNFKLEHMLRSSTANRLGFTEQYTPSPQIVANLIDLCRYVLQPIRDKHGVVFVTSGYRCNRLNNAVKGSPDAHPFGYAADIKSTSLTARQLFENILKMGLEFDQIILEFDVWIHISYRKGNNRNEVLEAVLVNGRTKYIKYIKKDAV